ncbi:hypothetical protein GGQ54_002930 [Naumannella cuiyingiana]|uniref:Uncharacterized protein n=1 Tax=Naumannella cuiyingiana TaxID=1347891 RepID=A0A7Z0DB58_9ACTN|nr:hypothetical protein [Naumannella cuiyingiana]NYI72370.1 hypothetical protein [Naumannella cuiyingiana]
MSIDRVQIVDASLGEDWLNEERRDLARACREAQLGAAHKQRLLLVTDR